jgi:hypothetical protein
MYILSIIHVTSRSPIFFLLQPCRHRISSLTSSPVVAACPSTVAGGGPHYLGDPWSQWVFHVGHSEKKRKTAKWNTRIPTHFRVSKKGKELSKRNERVCKLTDRLDDFNLDTHKGYVNCGSLILRSCFNKAATVNSELRLQFPGYGAPAVATSQMPSSSHGPAPTYYTFNSVVPAESEGAYTSSVNGGGSTEGDSEGEGSDCSGSGLSAKVPHTQQRRGPIAPPPRFHHVPIDSQLDEAHNKLKKVCQLPCLRVARYGAATLLPQWCVWFDVDCLSKSIVRLHVCTCDKTYCLYCTTDNVRIPSMHGHASNASYGTNL